MLGGFLGGLANLGAVEEGADQAQYRDILRQLAMQQMQQRRMEMLQQQKQQQTMQGIGGLIGQPGFQQLLQGMQGGGQGMQGGGQQMPQQQPPQMPGAGVAGGFLPQVPQTGGAMGQAPPRLPGVQGGQYAGGMTSGLTLPQLQDEIYNLESSRGANTSTSPAGAIGPMQVMPATARQYGFTPEQAATSREPGNAIVSDLYSKYGGNPDLTAIAYNAGPGRADKIAGGAPLSSLPGETQNYLAKMHRDLDLGPEQQVQVQQGVQQAVRGIPNILQTAGRWDVAGLTKLIDQQSDDPEVKAGMFLKMFPLLSGEAKEQAAQIFQGYQQGEKEREFGVSKALQEREFDIRERDTQAQRAATDAFRAQSLAQGAEKVTPQTQAFEAFKKANPNATPEEMQQFIQTGRPARSGQSAAVQKFMTEHPNATADEIAAFTAKTAAEVSGTRAFDTGMQGNTVRSINVAVDHLAVLEDAGKGLENTPIQWVNRVANSWAKETGQPAPTDFAGVKAIVKDELVKAVLGGVGALGDRQEVENTIDAASSPEQLSGVIRRYEQLMGGQMRGLQQQFTTSGIGSPEDFDKKLFPRTRSVLGGAGQPGGTTDWSSMSNEELLRRSQEAQ